MTFVRTFKRRKAFLDALEVGDSESLAAAKADGDIRSFRKWRREDSAFSDDWDEAIETGTDYIEDIATTRAMVKSDPLMLAILKARRPEKYDRNSGKASVEVNVNVEGARAKLLNKVARLQAQRQLPGESGEEVDGVLGDQEAETAEARLLLPPPTTSIPGERGSKRQRVARGHRGEGEDRRTA